jgi:hypothetical protein
MQTAQRILHALANKTPNAASFAAKLDDSIMVSLQFWTPTLIHAAPDHMTTTDATSVSAGARGSNVELAWPLLHAPLTAACRSDRCC